MDDADPAEAAILVNGRRLRTITSHRPPPSPTCILEAGLGATADFWGWTQPALAASASTLSYDRAGVVGSDAATPRFSEDAVDRALADLGGVIATLGPRSRRVLIGHSSGALLVQAFAAAFPETVDALVLIDPTPADSRVLPPWMRHAFGPSASASRGLAWLADRGAFKDFNPFAGPVATLPPMAAARAAAAMIKGSHLRAMADELTWLSALQARALAVADHVVAPTLIISAATWAKRGDLGRAILASHKSLAEKAPNNRGVAIDGADHMSLATVRAHAEACVTQITRFVGDLANVP